MIGCSCLAQRRAPTTHTKNAFLGRHFERPNLRRPGGQRSLRAIPMVGGGEERSGHETNEVRCTAPLRPEGRGAAQGRPCWGGWHVHFGGNGLGPHAGVHRMEQFPTLGHHIPSDSPPAVSHIITQLSHNLNNQCDKKSVFGIPPTAKKLWRIFRFHFPSLGEGGIVFGLI